MGERLTLYVYKEVDEDQFKSVFERVLRSKGGKIFWNERKETLGTDCRMAHNGQVHSVYSQYQDGEWLFYGELGKTLNLPWVKLDIHEGSLWQAMFYRADKAVDCFSTVPEYWEGEDTTQDYLDQWKGKPEAVSALWGIPVETINRYMVNWGYHVIDDGMFDYLVNKQERAYPEDKHNYADIWQMMDFLRALGGFNPTDLKDHGIPHRIELPSRKDLQK